MVEWKGLWHAWYSYFGSFAIPERNNTTHASIQQNGGVLKDWSKEGCVCTVELLYILSVNLSQMYI